jgi:hypothetical protein
VWALIGQYLCSRSVHKELGGPIYSTEGVTWLVAVHRGQTIGFASLRSAAGALHHDYSYVVEGQRKSGVHSALAAARDKLSIDSVLPRRVVCRESRWHHYADRGWQVLSQRGSWIHGELRP